VPPPRGADKAPHEVNDRFRKGTYALASRGGQVRYLNYFVNGGEGG